MMDRQLTIGQDSFLDIVANLVGILIILVVVVGAHAASVWQKTDVGQELEKQLQDLQLQTSQAAGTAESLQLENHSLEQKIHSESTYNARLEQQRNGLLVQLEMVKRNAELSSKDFDTRKQEQLKSAAEIDRLHYQIDQTARNIEAVRKLNRPTRATIEHYPTPIAKTVFSNEIHFRILDGNVVYVPLEELVSRMKSEWKVKAEKLKTVPETVETVGPIGDFRLQYELEATQVPGPGGMQNGVQFKRFSLQPLGDDIGESVEQALSENSRFKTTLSRLIPEKTTVSVWVYPDSYAQFAELKDWLRRQGFQTASWPLAHGRPIAGGPAGFRTAAN